MADAVDVEIDGLEVSTVLSKLQFSWWRYTPHSLLNMLVAMGWPNQDGKRRVFWCVFGVFSI
jgi:hypothetical protein